MSDLSTLPRDAELLCTAGALARLLLKIHDDRERQRALLARLRILEPVVEDTDAHGPHIDYMNTIEVDLGADLRMVNERTLNEMRAARLSDDASLPLPLRRWI